MAPNHQVENIDDNAPNSHLLCWETNEMKESTRLTKSDLIPFEAFVGFKRLKKVNPILACEPPEWVPLPTRWSWMDRTLPVG